ncbi:MAG: lycopene cyclase family protein [Chitinophagaceae bacterium]
MESYDYIVCGAGCAGLTFLYEIISYESISNKKILLIDSDYKTKNDRTWCFWSDDNLLQNKFPSYSWDYLEFLANDYSSCFAIKPYRYNKINGIDFYNAILNLIAHYPNIQFLKSNINSINNTKNGVTVVTDNGVFSALYAFNSIIFNKKNIITPNSLLQHFKGIEIETKENSFNETKATFMDFSISQTKGTSFMYVLPTTSKTALIEYTLFTKNILKEQEYDTELSNYIKDKLGIKEYEIKHTEFGIIPMTDYKFKLYDGNIINLGTAAGCVKASSGFAFKNIQKHTKQVVDLLAKGKKPYLKKSFNDKKFHLYDSVLLEVIAQNKMQGSEIFANIFKKNKPQLVLKFLDNETNIWEDLQIMASVPSSIFLPIAIKKLF